MMTHGFMDAMKICMVILACSCAGHEAGVNSLPPYLMEQPAMQSAHAGQLQGIVSGLSSSRPRAVLGYVSEKQWALMEFATMTYASWSHLMSRPNPGVKVDLFAFCHPRWSEELSKICTVLDLDADFDALVSGAPQCFVIVYPPPPDVIWHKYPFINNVHFFSDDRVAEIMTRHYGLIMKSDFDCFLTPGFIAHNPKQLTFGIQEYGVMSETRDRLKRISKDLGFRHAGKHNLGPTWLGEPATVIAMANLTLPVLYHIITREFDQIPGGGIAQKWHQGEGFPLWSAGMAAMYATELIANHFLENFESTNLMDMHADSDFSTMKVLHIHCRHGDGDFNKFEFFKHHYDDVDLKTLDVSIVRDYATQLAVSTWRMINPPRPAEVHAEL